MLTGSRTHRCRGEVLYPRNSHLPRDFYRCCREHFGIILHADTYIGVRSSQQRGLFLSTERTAPLEANSPIATIPLSAIYTAENISAKPNALHHVTQHHISEAIQLDEFKIMAPQLHLGLQFAAIISAMPDIHTLEARALEGAFEVLAGGANPWARMLDDEDFNDDFVYGMYGMTLDSWQKESYQEIQRMYKAVTVSIHEAVKPHFSLDHYRRIARLVLARAEHVRPAEYYAGSYTARWFRRHVRRLCRHPDVHYDVAMVPLIDLVNHSNRPNCTVRVGPSPHLDGAPAVTLHSLGKIMPGEELCRHYNFALSRASALFRYGFLPFDLIAIVDADSVHEHFVKNKPEMVPKSELERAKDEKLAADVSRLEKLYQTARRTQPTTLHKN